MASPLCAAHSFSLIASTGELVMGKVYSGSIGGQASYQIQEILQVVGKRGKEFDRLATARVREAEPRGVQERAIQSADRGAQAGVFDRVGAARVVGRVGDDRVFEVRQVDANLVCAPGLDF